MAFTRSNCFGAHRIIWLYIPACHPLKAVLVVVTATINRGAKRGSSLPLSLPFLRGEWALGGEVFTQPLCAGGPAVFAMQGVPRRCVEGGEQWWAGRADWQMPAVTNQIPPKIIVPWNWRLSSWIDNILFTLFFICAHLCHRQWCA